jgi:hypothetical protein
LKGSERKFGKISREVVVAHITVMFVEVKRSVNIFFRRDGFRAI